MATAVTASAASVASATIHRMLMIDAAVVLLLFIGFGVASVVVGSSPAVPVGHVWAIASGEEARCFCRMTLWVAVSVSVTASAAHVVAGAIAAVSGVGGLVLSEVSVMLVGGLGPVTVAWAVVAPVVGVVSPLSSVGTGCMSPVTVDGGDVLWLPVVAGGSGGVWALVWVEASVVASVVVAVVVGGTGPVSGSLVALTSMHHGAVYAVVRCWRFCPGAWSAVGSGPSGRAVAVGLSSSIVSIGGAGPQ